MVMMRYVLCIITLLLSCACVHVLAEEVPAADLSDQVPDTESEANCLDAPEGPENKECAQKKEGPPAKVPEVPKEVVPEKKVPVVPPKKPKVPPEVPEVLTAPAVHHERTASQEENNGHGKDVNDASRAAGPQGVVTQALSICVSTLILLLIT
ncbi:uncharacterized protein TM35_000961100 [Trypanosoma theileri]|uniref:Titin n=1 Tax=Trypanosoma theileri TaxID=67003 RepID=A0A1X0NEZ7_9TRYP|nr:uncharacterized protein TM35_000961100 [Trypanosoma theileri]ORC82231.1 hypothetical protein TM35_000961100 [Trypanosoma theileri]